MSNRSATPHLDDIIEAIERVRQVIGDMPLAAFETDCKNNGWYNGASRSSPRPAAGCLTI